MSVITILVLIFSVVGAVDYLLGNRLGAGREFEKAFSLFCPMALSMLGMIVLAPAIGQWLTPIFDGFYRIFHMDPSIIPASFLANDMGGMTLAQTVCKSETMGGYNAFVVSSMMGCVISFTIPFSLGLVKKNQQRQLFFGLLCGIVTIPVGCFAAGLLCGLGVGPVLWNLLPLIVLGIAVGAALVLVPEICIRCFAVFGYFMKLLAVVGMVCAVVTFLTGITISPYFDTLPNAAMVCVNACVTLSGALPFMYLVSKILHRPLHRLGSVMGINGVSALAFLGSSVTNATTFGMADQMDAKGLTVNAAFAVSASFVFGSHLAFTMAYDSTYVLPMIVGKLISGLCAVGLALLLYRDAPSE